MGIKEEILDNLEDVQPFGMDLGELSGFVKADEGTVSTALKELITDGNVGVRNVGGDLFYIAETTTKS
jgi:predicted transcriptional regulator